jgi:signal transduction histidine kinase
MIGGGLAFWGGGELRKNRRLSLLLGVSRFSNPRFGVDETIVMMAQRLRSFFDTDSCVIIFTASDGLHHLLYRSDRRASEQGTDAVTLVDSVAQRLLSLPNKQSFVYKEDGGLTRMARSFRSLRKAVAIFPSRAPAEELEAVAEMFGAKAFMSVPLNLCFAKVGRVYLIDKGRRTFRQDDLDLVVDAVKLAKPAIENVRLLYNLATEAAEQERKRIAMDLHDTTIQPFIGLMLGLSAVRCRIELDPAGAAEDVSRLLRAAEAELGEVRGYVRALKDKNGEAYEFLTAVRRLTEKFEEASGIPVELEVEGQVKLNDRLAAEAFQLIAEGLSNIRRHARATHAALGIACRDNQLHLLFRNDVPEGVSPAAFCPRSLSERTASLGGTLKVCHEGFDGTQVQIFIPL